MHKLSKATIGLKLKRVFYGWYVIIACAVIAFFGLGIGIRSMPLLWTRIASDLQLDNFYISITFFILILTSLIFSVIFFTLVKKINIKILMEISILIFSIALFSMAFADKLYEFYIIAFFLGFSLAGMVFVPIPYIVFNWFYKYRHLSFTIIYIGLSLGGVMILPLMTFLTSTNIFYMNYGWKSALIFFSILTFVVCELLTVLIICIKPKDKNLYPDNSFMVSEHDIKGWSNEGASAKEIVKKPIFLLGLLLMFVFGATSSGTLQYSVSYFEKNMGITIASLIYSFTFAISIVGREIFNFMLKVRGALFTLLFFLVSLLIGYGFLILTKSTLTGSLFMVFMGLGDVVSYMLPLVFIKLLFGTKSYYAVLPITISALFLGTAVGTPLTAFIYKTMGTYTSAFSIYIGVILLASLILLQVIRERDFAE